MEQINSSSTTRPLARNTELTVEHLSSEIIIYDHQRHRVHCLNETLAFVWEHCDGQTTIEEMAESLPGVGNLPADQDIIRTALRQLDKVHLLAADLPGLTSIHVPSRREMARKCARLGFAAALLPAVTSIIAPTPSMAASKDSHSGGDKDKDQNKDKDKDKDNRLGHY